MEKKQKIILLIISMILIALVGAGLAGGIYYVLERNDENDTNAALQPLQQEFSRQLTGIINLYAYTLGIYILFTFFLNN
jgi:flagellar basal body-associated protein FliL